MAQTKSATCRGPWIEAFIKRCFIRVSPDYSVRAERSSEVILSLAKDLCIAISCVQDLYKAPQRFILCCPRNLEAR
jgi:hypothetical protein